MSLDNQQPFDIHLNDCTNFRYKILCATLSNHSLIIDKIRIDEDIIGLKNYEANFLRLIEKVSNGSCIEIDESGSVLKYTPGTVVNGINIVHECDNEK